jgi:hypothetical protein
MAFMEILKIIQHQVFLRNCRGKVLEKFPVFSDTTAGLCEFSTPASAGCQPRLVRSSRTTRSRSEPPNHASGLSRGDVGQLSVERWGRYKPGRQAYEHAIVASAGPGETVKLAASHWFG